MHLIRRLRRDERGATLVIMALVLVLLMGFAAIAVDLAHKWSLTRQDQSASDTGSVAGLLFTADRTFATAVTDATNEIVRITFASAQPGVAFADWQTAYNNCVDGAKPAEFTVTGTSDCVSFTSNLEKVRVRLPNVDFDTAFGGVIGVDVISTSAFAEARIHLAGRGNVLPFGLPQAAASDPEVCLKTGSNPQTVPPCDGPATGNFGFLDLTHFGYEPLGTTTQCTGGTATRMARNIAIGVDHPLGETANLADPFDRDRDQCNNGPNYNARPHTLQTETGNMTGVLDDGLVDGVGSDPGRLVPPNVPFASTTPVAGHDVDDKPIWEYMSPAGFSWCEGMTADLTLDHHDEVIACVAAWTDGVDPELFDNTDDGIKSSVRFAWVPVFHNMTLGAGNSDLNVKDYHPVFIQTTLWKCNSSSCDIIHDPGETLSGTNLSGTNKKINAMSAIQIPENALPVEIRNTAPGTQGNVEYVIDR